MNNYIKLYKIIFSTKKTLAISAIASAYAIIEVVTLGATAFFLQIISAGGNIARLEEANNNEAIKYFLLKNNIEKYIIYIFLGLVVVRYIYSVMYFRVIYDEIFKAGEKLNKIIAEKTFGKKYVDLKNQTFQASKNIFYKEIDYGITYFIQPLLLLYADILQMIFLIGVLTLTLPGSFLPIIVAMGILIYIINTFIKSKVVSLSEELTIHQRNRTNSIENFYTNIFYWNVKQLRERMTSLFQKNNELIAFCSAKLNYLQQIPRLSFEIVIYLSIGIVYLFSLKNPEILFFNYIVLGLAAIKMMPSAVKISSFWQSALSSKMVITSLLEVLENQGLEQNRQKTVILRDFRKLIELKDASYRYNEKFVIKDANITINKNEIISISGSSGAGKTTLVEILVRQLDLHNGVLMFDHVNITNSTIDMSRIIGVVPQTPQFINDTLRQNIVFGNNEIINEDLIEHVLEECNLRTLINELPEGLDTIIDNQSNNFSGGERQRIAVARCLLGKDVKIIIFDEVTSSLDGANSLALMESIMKFKGSYTMIFITHDKLVTRYCDKNYELNNGKLALVS